MVGREKPRSRYWVARRERLRGVKEGRRVRSGREKRRVLNQYILPSCLLTVSVSSVEDGRGGIRFPQVVQGRDALGSHLLDMLEYDARVGSGWQGYRRGRPQSAGVVVHGTGAISSGVLPPQARLGFTAI